MFTKNSELISVKNSRRSIRKRGVMIGPEDWKEGIMSANAGRFADDPMPISSIRIFTLTSLIIVGLLVITWRAFTLQIVEGKTHLIRSERNRMYVKYVQPERGVIYDRNGVVLARNAPAYSLVVIYKEVPQDGLDAVVSTIREIVNVEALEWDERWAYAVQNPNIEVVIKRYLTHEEQIGIKLREEDITGFAIKQDVIREYPEGEPFSAVLGYLGKINQEELATADGSKYLIGSYLGKNGIEARYEDQLVGTLGRNMVEIGANGKPIQELLLQKSVPGKDVTLTIDSVVHKKVAELLKIAIEKNDAVGGSAIIMDPTTGEVLAIITLPTYDNRIFQSEPQKVASVLNDGRGLLLNRSIGGVFAAGSIVKMAVGAEALQRGVISPRTQISSDPQVIRIGGWEFPDWTHTWGRASYGMLDFPKALSVSSDTFFYKISGGYPPGCDDVSVACQVRGMGEDGVIAALRKFGFGQKVGIDLPGEVSGLVPDPNWKQEVRGEPWYLGNTLHLSIGQGDLLVTPLQGINLTNIVATDSKTPVPHLLKNTEILGDDFHLKTNDKPVYLDNLKLARDGMVLSVSDGIIFPLRGAKVPTAAKTGTAEFGTLDAKGEYKTHSWVTGFAPVSEPKVSFIFLLESGGTSTKAAEVAREFIDWYFSSPRS